MKQRTLQQETSIESQQAAVFSAAKIMPLDKAVLLNKVHREVDDISCH